MNKQLIHIDWVNPDDIVIINISNDTSNIKITTDVQVNGVTKIRLLKKIISENHPNDNSESYFRYTVNNEITWFFVGNPIPRKGVYYTNILHCIDTNELNILYRVFNREDKLNILLSSTRK